MSIASVKMMRSRFICSWLEKCFCFFGISCLRFCIAICNDVLLDIRNYNNTQDKCGPIDILVEWTEWNLQATYARPQTARKNCMDRPAAEQSASDYTGHRAQPPREDFVSIWPMDETARHIFVSQMAHAERRRRRYAFLALARHASVQASGQG